MSTDLKEYHRVIDKAMKKIMDPNISTRNRIRYARVAIAAQERVAKTIGLDKHGSTRT